MHATSTVGEKCADVRKLIFMAIVHVCNLALYLAYVQGLFTMTKAGIVCHYHSYM